MGRTNRGRRKLTVYLADEDRENAAKIQRATSFRSEGAAIRYALRATANRFADPPDLQPALSILVELAEFARGLEIAPERDLRRARDLASRAVLVLKEAGVEVFEQTGHVAPLRR